MRKNRQWLKYSINSIISIILVISIFNYKIDSLGIFGNSNYLSKVAEALASGQMIAGLKNIDERLLQELIIKNIQTKNDVIAIGSSKTMMLRKRFFLDSKSNFFNHSVSGASLEDYIAIVGVYESIHGYLPSKVIIGIDPWIFNQNNGQQRWKTLNKYYSSEIKKIQNTKLNNPDNINTTKWKQLFNYDYTISNIKFLKSSIKNNGKTFYITDTVEIDNYIKEADGSIHYPFKLRYPDYNAVEILATKHATKPVYSLENYTKLDNVKLFENFIKYLKLKNVEVVFFLPPYHPIGYDILIKDARYKILIEVERHLLELSSKYKIHTIGSYNPHKYKLTNKDFIDGMHADESVIKNLFISESLTN